MKTVFVLFDSLNRSAMECYGPTEVQTPNFRRFAERAVTFDNHHVGSLPCIPARRDLQTGRLGFLHRSWGPLEPFDDSFPEILRQGGIYSHLATDHHHYFADGGATYHQRYSSWELVRGQAIDRWKPRVNPDLAALKQGFHPVQHHRTNYMINRAHVTEEKEFCGPQVFALAEDFLAANHAEDDWFLQIECFDPHEPFHAPQRFRDLYPRAYDGPVLDWPTYRKVSESAAEVAELRANYAALVSMCDAYFGRLLDLFDAHDLWRDTCLVLTTDHGFLLGEHDWWAKNRMPVYDEIARIPLMIHHLGFADQAGTRRAALTQTIDLMPTFLELHGQAIPEDVMGRSLLPVLARDQPLRTAALFGYFGAACNVTDGRHVYHRYPERMTAAGLHEYTLMPTRMMSRFAPEELEGATLAGPFGFTKGVPVLRLKPRCNADGDVVEVQGMDYADTVTRLYDRVADPGQLAPIADPVIEARMAGHLRRLMQEAEAPAELYARFGLEAADG